MENTETPPQKNEQEKGALSALLEACGLSGTKAKAIAGAILAIIAAITACLATSGCSVTYTKLPDGTVKASGAVVKPIYVTSEKAKAA